MTMHDKRILFLGLSPADTSEHVLKLSIALFDWQWLLLLYSSRRNKVKEALFIFKLSCVLH